MREVQDHFFRKAKQEGFLSRAAYKLIEIDDRKRVLKRGDIVLDCGAAPGSWIQVALQRVGSRGRIVGIDLHSIRHRFESDNVIAIEGDFTAMPADELLQHAPGGFDVILSDMAPKTTGDRTIDHHASMRLCSAVLERAVQLLKHGGNLVIKAFEGETYPDLLARCRPMFKQVKGYKPKSSRGESFEMFVIGHSFRSATDQNSDSCDVAATVKRRPSAGWGA